MRSWFNARRWLRQSLGGRLALVSFAWSLLAAVLITLWLSWADWREAEQQAQTQLEQVQSAYIPALTDALWTMDPQRLQSQLVALSKQPDLGLLELVDDSGKVTRIEPVSEHQLLAQRRYPLQMEIDGQQFALGHLLLSLDAGALKSRLWQAASTILLITFVALFLSSLLLLWLFQTWVASQLHQVANYARKLSADNLNAQLKLSRSTAHNDDEIGAIVTAFKGMQQRLAAELDRRNLVEEELKLHQEALEHKVMQRTTELASQTRQLELQSAQLQEQNLELNAFAHTVAHDLKHPVSAMIGMTTLLTKMTLPPAQQHVLLQQILQSAQKMNAMINSLLQLASLRSDADIEKTKVLVEQTVIDATASLQAMIKEHQPVIKIQGAFPAIHSHAQWLEEIWLNFISNAIKYGGRPAVIEIGATESAEQPNSWLFWVKDNGPGVPADKTDLLFQEFSRLDPGRLDSHGLGLSIVQRICNKLGGSCGYEALESGGSKFWFLLPTEPVS